MNDERALLLRQITRFLLVGAGVFIFQAALVEGGARLVGPVWAQIIVFPFAVTLAWFCNRRFTFAPTSRSLAYEWLRYALANGLGWLVSNLIYFALIWKSPLIHDHPVFAVAAGTAGGLIFNFSLSRYFVFNK